MRSGEGRRRWVRKGKGENRRSKMANCCKLIRKEMKSRAEEKRTPEMRKSNTKPERKIRTAGHKGKKGTADQKGNKGTANWKQKNSRPDRKIKQQIRKRSQ